MTSLGFDLSLDLKARGTGAEAPAPAAISSLEILAADGLRTVDDADAADANGWAAKVTLPDDGASAFDPGKIVLTVADRGFDAAGNPTIVQRTVTGTAVLRRQWPNQAQRLNLAAAGLRTVYFALSDVIYQGSTITAAAMPGYYGAAAAGAISATANGSTRGYPKPLFAWLTLQHDRATGSAFAIEGVAYHRHAMNGRQVACVSYQARDGQAVPNLSLEIIVSTPTLSNEARQLKPECYAADIPLAGLTDGDLCLVNAKVYPWIGDAGAVLDLSLAGNNPIGELETAHPQTPLRFVCDGGGGYGGAIAYVRPSGTLTGSSTAGVRTSALSDPSDAQCYPSIDAAMQAISAWNAVNKGHADIGGCDIFLTDDGAGSPTVHTMASGIDRTAGKCWANIRPDPTAAGAVSLSIAATRWLPSRCRLFVDITHSGGNGFDQGAAAPPGHAIAFEDMTLDAAGAVVPTNYRNPLSFWRNCTLVNFSGSNPLAPWADNARTKNVMVLGCTAHAAADTICYSYSLIANDFRRVNYEEMTLAARPSFPAQDGCILANNLFLNIRDPNRRGIGKDRALPSGFAAVQNVWEDARATNGGCLWEIGADGCIVPIDNVLFMHNSFPSATITGRFNAGYADAQNAGTGGTGAGVVKRIHYRGNLFAGHYNCKSDTFASGSQGGSATNKGRTGNWEIRYAVGAESNVIGQDTQNLSAADPAGGSWLGEWWAPSNRIGGLTIAFADNRAGQGAAGGGHYSLSGAGNDTYGRVAVGRAALRYDIAGNVRRDDGTGAAGAYERTA